MKSGAGFTLAGLTFFRRRAGENRRALRGAGGRIVEIEHRRGQPRRRAGLQGLGPNSRTLRGQPGQRPGPLPRIAAADRRRPAPPQAVAALSA